MVRCGDCASYRSSVATGVASGICTRQKSGEMAYKMVMYHQEAAGCSFFAPLDASRVRTDSKESPYDPQTWRPFNDYAEQKIDTSVDKEKLRNTREWG